MGGLNELSAAAAADRIARGDFTSVELTQACLDRVEAREPVVQAWVHIDAAAALAEAKKADQWQRDGKPLGPLHGVPVGIKDVIDTENLPTEHGSPLFAGRQPDRDARCVTALRRAGAVIMGKTVTTELANLHPGKTCNPRNPEHTPGGSSSGSAAAVADLHLPLALGTQTGGSVIRPASFNGIYGLKPTLGRVPREGVLLQSHSLDTVGVFGRSVEDLALAADCLCARGPDDAPTLKSDRTGIWDAFRGDLEEPSAFAFLRTPVWDHAETAAQAAIQGVVQSLGRKCSEQDLPEPWNAVAEMHACVMAAEGHFHYGGFLEDQPDLLSDVLRAHLEKGRSISAQAYIGALRARDAICRDLEQLLDSHDAVLCLSAPGAAPFGLETTGNPIFNGLWTYLGVPCVSLPRLSAGGMPLGLQVVGKRGGEGKLLRTAAWLDRWLQDAGA